MIFRQLRMQGCLSYLIGCEQDRVCAIVDPVQQVEPYLRILEQERLRLLYVIDTHTHADHYSGASALARQTGAQVVMHRGAPEQRRAAAGKGAEIGIADILAHNGAISIDRLVDEGDALEIGNLSLGILATQGHTLDSMCLRLADRLLTGDTLLIGQAGRLDLPGGSVERMYESLFTRVAGVGDDVIIYPGHDYRGNVNSTMGFERCNNEFLKPRSPEAFRQFVAKYFLPLPSSKDGAVAKDGAPLKCGITNMAGFSGGSSAQGMKSATSFFLEAVKMREEMFEEMEKYFLGFPSDTVTITAQELQEKLDRGERPFFLDVRDPADFAVGHLAGAVNMKVTEVPRRMRELPADEHAPIVVVCGAGFLSAYATMFLRVYGYNNVRNLEQGLLEWEKAGYPLSTG